MAFNPKSIYLPLGRKHVMAGGRWAHELGTDYWLQFPGAALDILAAASTATGDELAENGWVSTSLVATAGSGADFGSSSDKGTPPHALTNASADLLKSPPIFGDYVHMRAAADIAGMADLPRYLIARFWGAMTVGSADEPRSGWGFVEDGGSPATEADQAAWISCDSANFQIGCNAGTPDDMVASDAAWHEFAIVLSVATGKAYGYVDPTWRFGTPPLAAALGEVTLIADEAPYSFGFHALTTNRPALGLVHVYYDW
jgi:hypothetical protein